MTTKRPLAREEVLLSIVLPVFDEARVLERLHVEIAAALDACRTKGEVLFVDDGSRDETPALLDALAARDPRVRVLHLSRNFGQQAAVQAGLLHARGDAVFVMDADLQDDPSCIPAFLDAWLEGFDVVYAVRASRPEGFVKRVAFAAFYRLLDRIAEIPLPLDAGNLGLVDRSVAAQIAALRDRDRYYPGLRSWVGFAQKGVPVARRARYDGKPRVSLRGLFRLAKSATFSFSSFPLAMFHAIAVASALVFLAVAAFTLYHKLWTGLAIPGWTSGLLVASFFGAMNALGIGILGEYVLRIYDQVRERPVFLVARRVNCEPPVEPPASG